MNDNHAAAQREALRTPVELAARRALREIERATAADLTWQADAACRDVPATTASAMGAARTVEDVEVLGWRCVGCPVAWQCLCFGIDSRASGLFGGFILQSGEDIASLDGSPAPGRRPAARQRRAAQGGAA